MSKNIYNVIERNDSKTLLERDGEFFVLNDNASIEEINLDNLDGCKGNFSRFAIERVYQNLMN